MTRLRSIVLHSPGLSAIAAMIALVSVAWAAPEIATSQAAAAHAAAFA